jgi:hypothetical protein
LTSSLAAIALGFSFIAISLFFKKEKRQLTAYPICFLLFTLNFCALVLSNFQILELKL